MIALVSELVARAGLPVLERWLDYLKARGTSEGAVAIRQIEAEIARRNAARDMVVAEQGRWFTALHRSIFIYPTGFYYAAIVADSLLHFEWNVAALPPPYDQWGFAIVSALFLVDGAQMVARSVARKRIANSE